MVTIENEYRVPLGTRRASTESRIFEEKLGLINNSSIQPDAMNRIVPAAISSPKRILNAASDWIGTGRASLLLSDAMDVPSASVIITGTFLRDAQIKDSDKLRFEVISKVSDRRMCPEDHINI